MVSAIKQGRKPSTILSDNIQSFALIGAALQSIQHNREIDVQEMLGIRSAI